MRGKPERTAVVPKLTDHYLELIKQLPLRRLRDDADARRAGAMLSTLAARGEENLSLGERDYLEALTLILQAYEQQRDPIPADKRTPLQRLKYLMRESKMKPVHLGKLVGGRAQASLILHGKRELSKANIRALSDHFKLDAGYFL
jgi:antitoxin component HigA of HigAB toxin-antitoxin module